jgi:hypothetical protein
MIEFARGPFSLLIVGAWAVGYFDVPIFKILVAPPDFRLPGGPRRAKALDRPGYLAYRTRGSVWVMPDRSESAPRIPPLKERKKWVAKPKAGPEGLTVKAANESVLRGYLLSKPGFAAKVEDGRLWVFKAGSNELRAFEKDGVVPRHVVIPRFGPNGMTLKVPDKGLLQGYLSAKWGFETFVEGGQLWVFVTGAKELAEFKKAKSLTKHVTRAGAGPMKMTIKAADAATIDAYLKAAP